MTGARLASTAGEVRARVRRSYGAAATRAGGCGCGDAGGGCGGVAPASPAEALVRIEADTDPSAAADGPAPLEGPALGCGNPLAVAAIAPGEVVLDLGSGAGAEVLRAARLTAPGGMAIGLDMTAEMLALAAGNRRARKASNAFFVGGEIESLPLRDGSVDVVVSNCVLNLSPEKAAVFAEAWRVLRPGGRLAVADVVVVGDGEPPALWRDDAAGWDGCVRGAMTEAEVLRRLEEAGFTNVRLERLSGTGEPDSSDAAAPKLASDLILASKVGASRVGASKVGASRVGASRGAAGADGGGALGRQRGGRRGDAADDVRP